MSEPAADARTLNLGGRQVPFELRRSTRARRMTLTADSSRGIVRLTLPRRASAASAERFLGERMAWLADRAERFPEPRPYAPGLSVPFGDAALPLIHEAAAPRTPKLTADGLRVGGPADFFAERAERWLRSEMLALVKTDGAEMAAAAGLDITSVRFSARDTKRQWGSCSARGGISICWRLVHAPAFVRRAIIAHELAHLTYRHHRPAFHAECARLLQRSPEPAYAWLKANGAALHWFGRE